MDHDQSRLAVNLTVAQLRELIRLEVSTVFAHQTFAPAKPPKPYLTVKEAAELSGLGVSTIRLYIRKRQLKARKVGRRVIIAATDLDCFLALNRIEVRQ